MRLNFILVNRSIETDNYRQLPKGQMMIEQEEKGFIFVGEVMVLDLINTQKMVRGQEQDLLQTPRDLAQWWEAARHRYPEMNGANALVFDGAMLETVRGLRDQLRQIFLRVIEGTMPETADLAFLNAILRGAHPTIDWPANESPHMHYVSDDPAAQVLVIVALSALHLLTQADLSRLRQCHSRLIHRCILLFYDTTKSATREWCSTACLERERSARRYREKKGQSGT